MNYESKVNEMAKKLDNLTRIEKIPLYGEGVYKRHHLGLSMIKLINLAQKNKNSFYSTEEDKALKDLEWYRTIEDVGEDRLRWDSDDSFDPQKNLYWSALYNPQVMDALKKAVKNKSPYIFIRHMDTEEYVQYYHDSPCPYYFQKNRALLYSQLEIISQHKKHQRLDREFITDYPSAGKSLIRFRSKGSLKEINIEIPKNAEFYERILPRKDAYVNATLPDQPDISMYKLGAETMDEIFAEIFIFYRVA